LSLHGYDLTFCDPSGINISTPPEALHAILLGHGTCLLNSFARLEKEKKEQKEKKRKMMEKKKRKMILKRKMKQTQQKRRRGKNLLLQGIMKKVFTEKLDVGYWLGKPSDPDKTRAHFHSGYLPKAGKGDDNTTGKKQAHEMRGVLLTILCYC